MKTQNYNLPAAVFLFTALILSFAQIRLKNPIILAERFVEGAGWIEIFLIASYGAFVAFKMQNPINVPKWRGITWTIFSIVFFMQLILGLAGHEKFLMTGKLHLPIPMMILAGPIYRGHLSVMTILFLSTIILTGPAWCSHLCYFGAFDNIASRGKRFKGNLKNKTGIKFSFILLVIFFTLIFRWINLPVLIATIAGIIFGLAGIVIMIIFSRKRGTMIHCVLYCPIGTIVNFLRFTNPFRMYIDKSCNLCMKCTGFCKYDALKPTDIKNHKPGITCTLCGDCLAACRDNSIKYKYFNLNPMTSRNLYIFLTISLHASCLAMARI
jgi:polyferredoxin